jgi:pyruvate-formate lyase-activating enzyme
MTIAGAPPTVPVCAAYLVLPTFRRPAPAALRPGAFTTLWRRLRHLARYHCGLDLQLLLVDSRRRLLWLADANRPVPPSALAGTAPVVLLVNAAFLLEPAPSPTGLIAAAGQGRLCYQAAPDGEDLTALALPAEALASPSAGRAIMCLAVDVNVCADASALREPAFERHTPTAPGRKHSPAAAALARPRSRRGTFATAVLNTALAELLHGPADPAPAHGSPALLRDALLGRREHSAVPWVFNALVNHIEYRTGRATPASFPPEVHLALTGACNIECGFCSYSHAKAYFEYTGLEQVRRLDWLRHVSILRLSSGLGEPTINPHLPAILRFLAERHPHLALNFFTNGLALHRRGLIDALAHRATWINVSVNNASRESYQEMCGKDLFDRLCANLRRLHEAKLAGNTAFPIVHGSMVLTVQSVEDLPRMPGLCRELGIDRFTAFPFASLQTDCRYGPGDTLDKCRERYDALHAEAVAEAEKHKVSIEIPPPSNGRRLAFGLEVRPLYDFAHVEENQNPVATLVDELAYEPLPRPNCPQIWQTASIGARFRVHQGSAPNFLYPCLGPLCSVDFSTELGFDFPDADDFLALWNHPIFVRLRTAQGQPGLSPVCDVCRGTDTRHPATFATLEPLLEPWRPRPTFVAAPQLIGRISR